MCRGLIFAASQTTCFTCVRPFLFRDVRAYLAIWSPGAFGAVACSRLRARKHFLVRSRYGRRPNPNPSPNPNTNPNPNQEPKNGPKTGQKRARSAAAPRFENYLLFRSTDRHIVLSANDRSKNRPPRSGRPHGEVCCDAHHHVALSVPLGQPKRLLPRTDVTAVGVHFFLDGAPDLRTCIRRACYDRGIAFGFETVSERRASPGSLTQNRRE